MRTFEITEKDLRGHDQTVIEFSGHGKITSIEVYSETICDWVPVDLSKLKKSHAERVQMSVNEFLNQEKARA